MDENNSRLDRRSTGTRAGREGDDAETAAMRTRLQQLQAEVDRLRQEIDEHFTRLNATTETNRDGSKR
jgi:hypothetical protein